MIEMQHQQTKFVYGTNIIDGGHPSSNYYILLHQHEEPEAQEAFAILNFTMAPFHIIGENLE
jgi:hypothetical protein